MLVICCGFFSCGLYNVLCEIAVLDSSCTSGMHWWYWGLMFWWNVLVVLGFDVLVECMCGVDCRDLMY